MQQIKNLGSMKKLLGMMPGAGQLREQIDNFDERELVRTEAIIQSMTPAERHTPKILNGSRRLRIARGSGTTVTDVNQLVQRFEQAAKMMKTVSRGGMPQLPGMGAMGFAGGGKSSKNRKNAKKQKAKSGNPAKRAAEERALLERQAGGVATSGEKNTTAAAGSAFGVGQPKIPELPEGFDGLGGIFRR